jgi:hypothetical protein
MALGLKFFLLATKRPVLLNSSAIKLTPSGLTTGTI